MSKLLQLAAHPDEVVPMLRMLAAARRAKALPALKSDPSLQFCYEMLNRVSRSFAIVIQQLPVTLRDPVCVFYLVLRALDTVEDDMAVPVAVKVPLLRAFHKHCGDTGHVIDCGYGPYVDLMKRYAHVATVFNGLERGYGAVIADITRRMGNGMADFIEKEVETVADYDLYCHYVAGLVGIGLSDLFKSSNLEHHPSVVASPDLSNHMALTLQKTNIIRDYLEDVTEEPAPRMFWPREIWGQYARALPDLQHPSNRAAAVACLNHMVCDALRHFEPALTYMAGLADPDVFRFCAIPQVMAAHTLAACYNNPAVFTGVVKMRRGQTARVMLETNGLRDVYLSFARAARVIAGKAAAALAAGDPTAATVLSRARALESVCAKGLGLPAGARVQTRDARGAVGRALLLAAVVVLVLHALGRLPVLPLAPAWVAAALAVCAVGVQPVGVLVA